MSLFDPVILNKLDLLKKSVGSGGSGGSFVDASLQVQGDVTANQPVYFVPGTGMTGIPPVVGNTFNFTSVATGSTANLNSIISATTYTSVSDLKWVNNGTKLATCDLSYDGLAVFNASTPYDISTLSFVPGGGNASGSNTTFFNSISGFDWSPDGLTLSTVSTNGVYSFSVSTPYTFNALTSLGTAGVISGQSLEFSGDGTHVLIGNGTFVNQYNVTIPHRASTLVGGIARSLTVDGSVTGARYASNGYQLLVTSINSSGSADEIIIYNLTTAYNISTAVELIRITTTSSVSGVTIDTSGNLLTSDSNASGVIQRYDNSSIPLTSDVIDTNNSIGFSVVTTTSGNVASLVLTLSSKISYPGAIIGDELYVNSSGNLELNTSGDLIGYCIEDDSIYLTTSIEEKDLNYYKNPTKTQLSGISGASATNTIATISNSGFVIGVYVDNNSSNSLSAIVSLLLTYDDYVDEAVELNIGLNGNTSTGADNTDVFIPLQVSHKGPMTIKLVHTGSVSPSPNFKTVTYYKEVI